MNETKRFVVIVTFDLVPEAAAEFVQLVISNAQTSLSSEPGCLQFDVLQESKTKIWLYEVYRDASAFDVHLASAHFQAFDAATQHMVADKRVGQMVQLFGQ